MIFEPRTGIPVVSHKRMIEDAVRLKQLLQAEGLRFSQDSVLGQTIDASEKLSGWTKDPKSMPDGVRAPEVIRRITGLSYLARALFHAHASPAFPSLKRLLKHLAEDNPLPTEPLPQPHSSRNFVFELEVACHFLAKGFKARTAPEPDVILENSHRWNFACKMVSSEESNTVGENLSKGFRQVLKKEFPCDYGMVIMGLGQRLDLDSFLPVINREQDFWASFGNPEIPKRMLLSEVEALASQVLSQARTRIDDEDHRFRGVVLIAHALAAYRGGPMLLTATRLISRVDLFGNAVVGPEEELMTVFNDAAQRVFME
jgi:hypothetical protein